MLGGQSEGGISGWECWLYLKAERSAEPGSVRGRGRCLGVVRPQPERIARVQNDLQQSQPADCYNSSTASCPCIASLTSQQRICMSIQPCCLALLYIMPWHIPKVHGDLRHS